MRSHCWLPAWSHHSTAFSILLIIYICHCPLAPHLSNKLSPTPCSLPVPHQYIVWCIIITLLFSIISSGPGPVVDISHDVFHSHLKNLPFLKVFPSIAICPLLRLIPWNLTTRCLAVTGGDNVSECGRLSQPSWLLGALYYSYTYLLTYCGWKGSCEWPLENLLQQSVEVFSASLAWCLA